MLAELKSGRETGRVSMLRGQKLVVFGAESAEAGGVGAKFVRRMILLFKRSRSFGFGDSHQWGIIIL